MRIGIDIGNVIIGGDGEDTFFTDEYLETPEVVGAIDAIKSLSMSGYVTADYQIHLVSKCGYSTELRTMWWLRSRKILEFIAPQNIHFVRNRHLKAPMAQALELDIFIDDRQDIIDSMEGIVKHRILFTSWEETNKQLEQIWNSTH